MELLATIQQLQTAFTKPLPGSEAQLKMSSMRRAAELLSRPGSVNAIPSSVLVLLYPINTSTHIVFIQRPNYDGVHGGQIALPGGKMEHTDLDLICTALRESSEEIGIIPSTIHLLGKLTDLYIPPSNYMVSPYVGYSYDQPVFHPDPKEVAGIIQIELDRFMEEKARTIQPFTIKWGIRFNAPAYVIDNVVIWGATAMIISEFLEMFSKKL